MMWNHDKGRGNILKGKMVVEIHRTIAINLTRDYSSLRSTQISSGDQTFLSSVIPGVRRQAAPIKAAVSLSVRGTNF